MPEEARNEWHSFFHEFHTTLKHFSEASCSGCRSNPSSGNGCIGGCIIPACVKEHGVDYCAECEEFPCQKAKDFLDTVNDMVSRDWVNGSRRIKEVGIDAYFAEKKDVSHYISFKKKTEQVSPLFEEV